MSKQSERVQRWRKRVKTLLVQAFGGSCVLCGYSSCIEAMDFHHLDAADKELALSSWSTLNYAKLASEARKCALLCARCHREVHAGKHAVSPQCTFDSEWFEASCRVQKAVRTAEAKSASTKRRGNWLSVDVVALRAAGHTWDYIGELAGVSGTAALKRWSKVKDLPSSR